MNVGILLFLAVIGGVSYAYHIYSAYKKIQKHLQQSGTASGRRCSIISGCTGVPVKKIRQLDRWFDLGIAQ
ncbi:hypothetical protein [Nitrincola sp.]|uniref:hypothetical protein n=1 Tax=Nitrincola sp. TaxID=1926584 RepID=UPI003A8E7232